MEITSDFLSFFSPGLNSFTLYCTLVCAAVNLETGSVKFADDSVTVRLLLEYESDHGPVIVQTLFLGGMNLFCT